jgi:hypothetical protein
MKQRMISFLERPWVVRRAMSLRVGSCQRSRTTTMRYRAVLAWRSPPRFRRSWGALIRSCSSPVLTEQPAEQVAAVHLSSMIPADDGQLTGSVRCLESEGPVWTMPVVVLGVDPQDLLEMTSADDQQPVEALGADCANPPLREGVRVGRLHWREQHLGAL